MERKSVKLQKVPPVEKSPFKHSHHLVTLAAFRYALGRRSYIVSEIIDWIIEHWKEIQVETKKILLDETEQSLLLGHSGDECDQKEWERLLEFMRKSSHFR